jgi:hypothetical protein
MDMSSSRIVLVVRHPDYANAITVDGDVKVIDIDLGGSFYGSPGNDEDALEWAKNLEEWLYQVPTDSPAFTATVETVAEAVERYKKASDWVKAYVAGRHGEH